jgi:hypothetical protein
MGSVAYETMSEALDKQIVDFEALLIPPKKKVDTREVEESTLPASGSTAQEEESYGTQS